MAVGHKEEISVTAQNTFTPWVQISTRSGRTAEYAIHIDNIAGGTIVTLERAEDSAGTNMKPWKAYTGATNPADNGKEAVGGAWYRIGVRTGEYGSGTTVIALYYA